MTKRERLHTAISNRTGRNADLETREQVFRCVASAAKTAPHTVPAMVARLSKRGIEATPVSVNNHLRAMAQLGLIQIVGKAETEGRGRPATIWGLTESGQEVAELR